MGVNKKCRIINFKSSVKAAALLVLFVIGGIKV